MANSRPQPTIIVYSFADARAAAAAAAAFDLPIILRIPAGAAAGLGAEVIGKLFAILLDEIPHAQVTAVVDCADAPGLALALLRRGIDRVRVEGPEEMIHRISDIARQSGSALAGEPGESLDLQAAADPQAVCEAWLRAFKTDASKPNCE